MVTQIDITAGNILEFLEKKNDAVELSSLFSGLADPRDVVLMSLGWLIRRGCVVLKKEGQNYKVYLRKRNSPKTEAMGCPDFREGRQASCLASEGSLMTPSLYEINNFCLSNQYENCPLKKRQQPFADIF